MCTELFTHYLSGFVLLPLLAAVVMALLPFPANDKRYHAWGIGASALLFLYSLWGWFNPQVVDANPLTVLWLPSLGIQFALGADGISLTLVVLTTFLLLLSAIASITSITHRLKLYYSMLFVMAASVLGVFLARDLFLFFLAYEVELIPMYLLIAIWGGPRRQYAATKFVLYTLFGSVFMVAAILGIYFAAQQAGLPLDGLYLFSNLKPFLPTLALSTQTLMFLGLFVAFAIKLPVVPFHTWLPDAHVEAPTPVSMLLAGILLKMGGYGMLRLCWDFFPQAATSLGPWIALLAVTNILYAARVALVQTDLKKLIAYSSVSHMGFVLLGLAALNAIGFNGAMFVMFAHGLVSAASFMCVGTVYNRTHTRVIADMGGLAIPMPTIFYFFLFMSMASLGLPLLISFASESLVFYGAYTSQAFDVTVRLLGLSIPWNMQIVTFFSAIGVVIGAAYLLWMLKRVFYGPTPQQWQGLPDASRSEVLVLATLAILVVAYGVFPQQIMKAFEPDVTAIANQFTKTAATATNVPLPAVVSTKPSLRLSTLPQS